MFFEQVPLGGSGKSNLIKGRCFWWRQSPSRFYLELEKNSQALGYSQEVFEISCWGWQYNLLMDGVLASGWYLI